MTRISTSRVERAMLLMIGVATLILAILTPPFQVAEETQHFDRAVQIDGGRLMPQVRDGRVGGDIPRGYADLSRSYFALGGPGERREYNLSDLEISAHPRATDTDPIFAEFPAAVRTAPPLYAPQIVALGLARLLAMPPLYGFYLARLFDCAAFLLLLTLAVRVMPIARPLLLAVAALPTVTTQAASVAPQGVLFGLGFLVLALSLRAGFANRRTIRRRTFLISSAALGLCGAAYAPLALAGLRPTRRTLVIVSGILCVGSLAAWLTIAGLDQPVHDLISRRTGRLVTTAPVGAQVRVMFADPLRFGGILAGSAIERTPVYALQMVGRLGWNAILLPLVAYPLALAMLAAGAWASGGRAIPSANRLLWVALALVGWLSIEIAMYLTETPLAAGYIQGTQGRHLVPLLPLVGLASLPRRAGLAMRAAMARAMLIAAFVLQGLCLATVADAFWISGVTQERMPPHAEALRAMFLPSPRW